MWMLYGFYANVNVTWGSQVALIAKNCLTVQEMQETWVWSLVRKIPWRRAWQPTSVFLPGESCRQRSLVGSIGLRRIGYGWVHNDMCVLYVHSFSVIENNFTAMKKNPAYSSPIHPSLPAKPLAITDHFSVSIVLHFPECLMVRIT